MNIASLAEQYRDCIIQDRRYFHQNPELSFHEVETTRALKQRLEAMGISVTVFPDYNGLIGSIKSDRPGPVVILRADIDALPVEEKTGLPFCSTNGNMHACGHDCHTAMLLGAAKILTEIQDELSGEVRFLFQSAEESCYGARYYIEKNCLDSVDAIFGMHIWNGLDAHTFSLDSGGRMASCDNFSITVKGVSAHGSTPHLGKDAIVAAAAMVMNLQTFASRNSDPLNPLVVTIGTIKGGQRFNIIANEVVMEGTVRTYSRELRQTIDTDLQRIIDNTAHALGCEAEFDYQRYLGPVINEDEKCTRIARNAVVSLYGAQALVPMEKTMVSEDFSMFMEKVPGVFGFIGGRNQAIGAYLPNHNDRFDIDESVLPKGAALYAQFAVDYLRNA